VKGKIDQVLALLHRDAGATLAERVEATGWLPHTTRAALTGLKKKGYVIEKSKRGDVACYRIVEAG
jgi:DNA-binding IclR family transcriptional regulator